jgi:hypothetical protein
LAVVVMCVTYMHYSLRKILCRRYLAGRLLTGWMP